MRPYYQNRYYLRSSCCSHKHRVCCCEHENTTPVETCTAVNVNDFTFPSQVRGFLPSSGGGGLTYVFNTPQNVFNITSIADSSVQIDFFLQRDSGTSANLYGELIEYTTTGIPGIYDPNANPPSVGSEGFLDRGLPTLNEGIPNDEAVKFKLIRPPTGVWPANFSITILWTAQEYTKSAACKVSGSTTFFFVNENPVGTRSVLNVGSQSPGAVPQGTTYPYNLVFNNTVKATSPSGPSFDYVINNTPGINTQTVFTQGPNLKFLQTINNDTGGPISFTDIKDDNETFTLTEVATYADGTPLGVKTFNVTVQPPNVPRNGYKLPPGMPNDGGNLPTERSSGVSYINNSQTVLYIVQGTSGVPPIVFIPFQWTKGSSVATGSLPRMEINVGFLSQPTFNDPSTVTGEVVAPNGVTFPMKYYSAIGQGSFLPDVTDTTACRSWLDLNFPGGFHPMGFRFTNIPMWSGTFNSSQKLIVNSSVLSNFYKIGDLIQKTAFELFSSNDNGTPVTNLFQQVTTGSAEAGTLLLQQNGLGMTVLRVPKTNVYQLSMILFMQGSIVIVDSNGVGTDIFGCNIGVKDWQMVRLYEYPAFDQDADNFYYAFRKFIGGQGNIRGVGWYPK